MAVNNEIIGLRWLIFQVAKIESRGPWREMTVARRINVCCSIVVWTDNLRKRFVQPLLWSKVQNARVSMDVVPLQVQPQQSRSLQRTAGSALGLGPVLHRQERRPSTQVTTLLSHLH